MKDYAQLIGEIGVLVKGIWAHSEDPQNLSKDLNDLSVKHWALASWQGELEEEERALKAELDLEKARLMLEFIDIRKDPVNKAEIRVTIALAEQRKLYNKTRSNLEKVKVMVKANEKVLDSARSRLSLIKQELNQ